MTSVNTANTPPLPTIVSVGNITEYRKNIFSEEPTEQVKGVQLLRKLLSTTDDSQIQLVLDACAIPRLVQFLTAQHNPTLQYEVVIALRIVAMRKTPQTRRVINAGAIPFFIQLLYSSNNGDLRKQSIRALGIFASSSVEYRDVILNHGTLPALLNVIESSDETNNMSIIRTATWTISKLFYGNPSPNYEFIRNAIPILAKLILSTDVEIVKHVCRALSFLTSGYLNHNYDIINSGIGLHFIELLKINILPLQAAALRAIRNFTTGDEIDTQCYLDFNVLPVLLWLLDHSDKDMREEASWTIVNIVCGTIDQIQIVIDTNTIFPKLIELSYKVDSEVQKAVAYSYYAIWSSGTVEQILHLIQLGMISSLCHLLTVDNVKVIKDGLQSFNCLLEAAREIGDKEINSLVCNQLFEYNGWNNVEELQNHIDPDISSHAKTIYTTYFNEQDINGGLLK